MTGVGTISTTGNITVKKSGATILVNNGSNSIGLQNDSSKGIYSYTQSN